MANWSEETLRQMLAENDHLQVIATRSGGQRPGTTRSGPDVAEGQAAAKGKGKGRRKAQGQQDHVADLLARLAQAGLPAPRREHRFDAQAGGRQWRFDLDWGHLGAQVAVEIDGGIWLQTETGRGKGHAHPIRFLQDLEKLNAAALAGWLVIRVAPEHIQSGQALAWIAQALAGLAGGQITQN